MITGRSFALILCSLGSGIVFIRLFLGSRKDDKDDPSGFDVAEYFGERDPVGGEDH